MLSFVLIEKVGCSILGQKLTISFALSDLKCMAKVSIHRFQSFFSKGQLISDHIFLPSLSNNEKKIDKYIVSYIKKLFSYVDVSSRHIFSNQAALWKINR